MPDTKYGTISGQKLGYYVHYLNNNYRNFGINLNETGGVSASEALEETHEMLKNQIKLNSFSGDVKSFEDFLNMLAHADSQGLAENFGVSEKEYNEAREAVINKIEEKYPLYSYNFENLDLESAFNVGEIYKYKGKQSNDRKYIQIQTIKKLIKNLNNSLKNIKQYLSNKGGAISLAEKDKIESIRRQIEVIRKELYKIKAEIRTTKSVMLTEENSPYIWNIVNFANDLAAAVILPSNEEQGDASELALGTFFTALTNKTNTVTDSMLNQILKGKTKITNTPVLRRGGFYYMGELTSTLNQRANTTKPGKERFQLSNGGIVDVIGSYDTTDLIITLPDDKQVFNDLGLNGLNASLKNYNNIDGYRGVHILGESPLLTGLNFVGINFANHYLNLFASGRYDSFAQSEYYDEMKRAYAVRGLLGMRDIYDTNSNLNQLFIVHNKGGDLGNVYRVFNANVLVEQYWNDIDKVVVKNLPTSAAFPNGWVDHSVPMLGAMARITNMLAHIHTIKITVSLLQLSSFA